MVYHWLGSLSAIVQTVDPLDLHDDVFTLLYLHNFFYFIPFRHFTIFPLIYTFITHTGIFLYIPFEIIIYSIGSATDHLTIILTNIYSLVLNTLSQEHS